MTDQADILWGYLIHLSFNMWADREAPDWDVEHTSTKPYLRFDDGLWRDLCERMVQVGANMVVVDLGDGVQYESHPEISVEGAWTTDRLRQELRALRERGIEPFPKLNFSTAHDAWLGPYARCVSTDLYYQVCRDLVAEVIDLFDGPRFFHLGMDEETAHHQRHYQYALVRQYDLWWHDLRFLVDQVESCGSRAWVWSDYVWDHPELFYQNMPKSVVQSNWYYGAAFGADVAHCNAYMGLGEHGYDQIPTGSNWSCEENMVGTVAFCQRHIDPERLMGFLQTVWKPTIEGCRQRHEQALDLLGEARARWLQLEGGE